MNGTALGIRAFVNEKKEKKSAATMVGDPPMIFLNSFVE